MKNILLFICVCAALLPGAASNVVPGTPEDFMDSRREKKVVKIFDKNWKFFKGDKKEFSDPGFDDSRWKNIQIGKPLAPENRRKYCWYRITFELPQKPERGFYELDLGYVSAGEQVFCNGMKIGEYGFKKVVNNSSNIRRRYRFNDQKGIFRKGRNVLALRVKMGYKFGMYAGIPQLHKLNDCQVLGELNNHSVGRTAVFRHISLTEEINAFLPGDRIAVSPRLTLYGTKEKITGSLKTTVTKGRKVLARFDEPLTLLQNKWVCGKIRELKNSGLGRYQAVFDFVSDKKSLWKKTVSFTVAPQKAPVLKVDRALRDFEKKPFSLRVGDRSFGSLGLRDLDKNFRLFDNYNTPDLRAGLGNSFGLSKRYPGVMLLHSHIKSTAAVRSASFIDQPGRRYDGFECGWSAGWIRPAAGKKITAAASLQTEWTRKKIRLTYEDKSTLDVTISHLTPAAQLRSSSASLILFENFRQIGSPRLILAEKQGKLADAGRKITRMEKNYLVVSFRKARSWTGFDIPYLLVFEKRPLRVDLLKNGIKVTWKKAGSLLQVMPLYGVTLQPQDKFKANMLKRCRFWSKALQAMPCKVTRTAFVDYKNDRLLVRDSFEREIIRDDWNTPALKYVPVPPSLILAGASGLDLAVSSAVEDLDYAALNGPLYGMRGRDSYVFALNKMVHLVSEVRESSGLKDSEKVRQVKKELADIVRREMMPEITAHPWPALLSNKFGKHRGPGMVAEMFNNLMLTLSFLPADLRQKVLKEAEAEAPNFFDPELKTHWWKGGKSRKGKIFSEKATVQVYNPLSRKYMNTSAKHARTNAIDGPCWEALRLYLMWCSSYYCSNWTWVTKYLFEVEKSYNLLVNSHDWAYSLSWDSYSGIRLGNGVQESTICHAGFAAYARIMHQLGKTASRDEAVYHSLMQLVAVGSSISPDTIRFVRNFRPVPGENKLTADIVFLDRFFPDRFCEFNERGGFFSWIINPRHLFYGGFIMTRLPEILRPFREYFFKFSDRYYSGMHDGDVVSLRNPENLDIFCYAMTRPPRPIEEIFEMCRLKRQLKWEKITDRRAFLEHNSKVSYKKLWNK